ncbi:MAG: hypothetical protein QOF51_2519 [Chloroflexota bacterium]|nr:hypothetical protein [Chloroflexota bacterium]
MATRHAPPPRIGINAQKLSLSQSYHAAGSSRYVHNLVRELRALDAEEQFLVYAREKDVPPDLASTANFRVVGTRAPTDRPIARILWEQLRLPRLLRHDHVTLFHGAINALPLAWEGPRIATILDLTFLRIPQAFNRSNRLYLTWMTRYVARHADRIITISEASRRDAIELLGAAPAHVVAIPLGVDPQFQPMSDHLAVARFREANGLPEHFILHLGTIEPRKNLLRLIDAYAELRRRGATDWPLILAGGRGWGDQPIFDRVAATGLDGAIRFAGFVPDSDLPLWYNAASLFTYPSEYEGFGLPVLEALACGTPVVASNSSSFPEVVGDAGILVDPADTRDMANGIERVLADDALRAHYASAGPERARRFSWRATAERTLAVYREVMAAT